MVDTFFNIKLLHNIKKADRDLATFSTGIKTTINLVGAYLGMELCDITQTG